MQPPVFLELQSHVRPEADRVTSAPLQVIGCYSIFQFSVALAKLIASTISLLFCRKCGRAVCDGCSPRRLPLPFKGHEVPVRVCEECHIKVDERETKSQACFYEMKHSVTHLSYDASKQVLVTSGSDHVVKIWNIKALL